MADENDNKPLVKPKSKFEAGPIGVGSDSLFDYKPTSLRDPGKWYKGSDGNNGIFYKETKIEPKDKHWFWDWNRLKDREVSTRTHDNIPQDNTDWMEAKIGPKELKIIDIMDQKIAKVVKARDSIGNQSKETMNLNGSIQDVSKQIEDLTKKNAHVGDYYNLNKCVDAMNELRDGYVERESYTTSERLTLDSRALSKILAILLVSLIFFLLAACLLIPYFEKKNRLARYTKHAVEIKFLIEQGLGIENVTVDIESGDITDANDNVVCNLSDFTHTPEKEFTLFGYFIGEGKNKWKPWIFGMIMGIVFGFIDNFGLFLGMESLEDFLENKHDNHKATWGNTFSDFIGATVGTSIGAAWVAAAHMENEVVLGDMMGIMIGCLIGVGAGKLMTGKYSWTKPERVDALYQKAFGNEDYAGEKFSTNIEFQGGPSDTEKMMMKYAIGFGFLIMGFAIPFAIEAGIKPNNESDKLDNEELKKAIENAIEKRGQQPQPTQPAVTIPGLG